MFTEGTYHPKSFQTISWEYNLPPTHIFHFHQSLVTETLQHLDLSHIRISSFLVYQKHRRLQCIYMGKDFSTKNLVDKLLKGFQTTSSAILSETWRAIKILNRAYFIYSFSKCPGSGQTSSQCPKCEQLNPFLTHCLGSCLPISHFWKSKNVVCNVGQVYSTTT